MASRASLEYDYLFKIVLVGDAAVGKTNLLACYTSQVKVFGQIVRACVYLSTELCTTCSLVAYAAKQSTVLFKSYAYWLSPVISSIHTSESRVPSYLV